MKKSSKLTEGPIIKGINAARNASGKEGGDPCPDWVRWHVCRVFPCAALKYGTRPNRISACTSIVSCLINTVDISGTAALCIPTSS